MSSSIDTGFRPKTNKNNSFFSKIFPFNSNSASSILPSFSSTKSSFLNSTLISSNNKKLLTKRNITILITVIYLFGYFLIDSNFLFLPNILSFFFLKKGTNLQNFDNLVNSKALHTDIPYHGIYKNYIYSDSELIYPKVADIRLLQETKLEHFFKVTEDSNNNLRFEYDLTASENEENNQIEDETEKEKLITQAKKSFRQTGMKIFKQTKRKQSPEVVIVTGLDLYKNKPDFITKIIHNRVDYSTSHKGYGVYIRYSQEFLPNLKEFNNDLKWGKLFIIREAMMAFPNAKYFWYLDESSIILQKNIDLRKHVLKTESLEPIILRDQPISLNNGVIKTYKRNKAEDIEFIISQDSEKLNTDSFIIKNSPTSKGLIEFWMNSLFRRYINFNNDDTKALSHILQWHPILLSKTAIVPNRSILSLHYDKHDYQHGDFVVNIKGCEERGNCYKLLKDYWKIFQGEKENISFN